MEAHEIRGELKISWLSFGQKAEGVTVTRLAKSRSRLCTQTSEPREWGSPATKWKGTGRMHLGGWASAPVPSGSHLATH